MSIQAEHYGRGLVCKRVEVLQRTDTGFVLRTASQTTHARAVILATGVAVTPPQMEALPEAVATGVIRYCPICDGFEVTDKRIAVLGSKQASIEEALFLRTYAADITFLKAVDFDMSAEEAQAAQQNGIRLEQRTLQTMFLAEGGLLVRYADGQSDRFDVLYPCLGSVPRSRLACSVGAEVTPSGGLLVDSRQQTNVPMLYAAGDVLEGLDQIASACGQAAIAATAIHNHLRKA
jgi:thioredoxin reductase (NADPH)